MAKGKWKYRRVANGAGIWCDDGSPGGRILWMESSSEFQIHMARLICKELNRAGVEASVDRRCFLEVVSRKACAAKKPEAAR